MVDGNTGELRTPPTGVKPYESEIRVQRDFSGRGVRYLEDGQSR